MTERTIFCPNCRRPIGPENATCPWCGTARPGFLWHALAWARTPNFADRLIAAIIGTNVVFYLLSLVLSSRLTGGGDLFSFLSPDRTSLLLLGATGTIPVLRLGRFWSLLAANYLHGGILHILFNMIAVRQIAPWVTREFGPSRMFVIYTVGGVGGFAVSCLAGVGFTIGASASVCALIGALLYYGKSRGGSYGMAVSREVTGWLISLAIFGFIAPGINNWGHGGGVVCGVALGKLLGYEERRPEGVRDQVVMVFCLLVTVAVLAWGAFSGYALPRWTGMGHI